MLVVWLTVIAAAVGALAALEVAIGPRVALVGVAGIAVFLPSGLFTLQPNEARVLILFGNYHGTVREGGFHWANPLYSNGTERGPLHRKLQKLGAKDVVHLDDERRAAMVSNLMVVLCGESEVHLS